MKKIATWGFAVYGIICLPSQSNAAFDTILNISTADQVAPILIESNTQLNLSGDGSLPHQFEAGSPDGTSTNIEVNISGGAVGSLFNAYDGTVVNMSGGSIGNNFSVWDGGVLHLNSGEIGDAFAARSGSTITITSGTIGDSFNILPEVFLSITDGEIGDGFTVFEDGVVEISGGTFGHRLQALKGSRLRISGGEFAPAFLAFPQSHVELFGSKFFINDQPIDGLSRGVPLTISDRDVFLSGILADGSKFEFALIDRLFENNPVYSDYFDVEANLTIHLIPEPRTGLLFIFGILHAVAYGCHG
ncbi:MAG: hypothetical protein AAGD11_05790 [Planctomycetota bacterium]